MEEKNRQKNNALIFEYISDKEQLESISKESFTALQNALYEDVCFCRAKPLSDAMYELNDRIAELNAKLSFKTYLLTPEVPSGTFRFEVEKACEMLELYKIRAVYTIKRGIIYKALMSLTEYSCELPQSSTPETGNTDSSSPVFIEYDNEDEDDWNKDTYDSISEDIHEITYGIAFDEFLSSCHDSIALLSALEKIDAIIARTNDYIQEASFHLNSLKSDRNNILSKHDLVLKRLKSSLTSKDTN